ncbi:unnamed protein product [Cyprideis torosa]|uniref:polo kinase n=1 Tax=Cyprideis torosa TaxID=163714 RepID=A0A7R8W066_9CRUS|nr:unnamed protein product [Cyprideis torosa]CAG0879237.1 unnamed protein product [Cyprideis torosa]
MKRNPTICGTPNYIAPEVLNKLGHHYEADTWALGCIMYAMLVGHPPFETSTLKETYYRIANNKYILPPSLSPPAANLLRVLLHPSRSCRPTLSAIQQHNFFNSGYMPKALSTWCCTVPPKFPTSVMITRPTSLILESPSSVPVVPEENRIRLVTTSFSRISLINGTANQGTSTHPVGVTNGGTTGVTCLSSTNSSSGNSSSSSSGNGGSSSSGNLQKSSSSSPPPQSTAMCSVSSAGNCVGLKKMSGVPSTCSSVSSSQSQCYVSSSTTNTTNSSSSSRKVSRSQSLKRETCVTCTRSRLSPSPPSNIPSTPPSSSSNNAPGSTGTPSPIVTSPWWHYSRQEPPKKPINGQHTRQHSASSAGPSPLETYSQKMFDAIVDGLDKMPEETNDNPPSIPITPVYISKWIDYSNKYGFGFQLSDHSVGVLFNDNTRMSCSSDKTYVEFRNSNGSLSVHPAHSVPSSLQERFTLLRYFVQYMDENLMEGGDPLRRNLGSQMTPPPRGTTGDPLPQMKRWVRSQKATVMQLTNGTVQVNFFKDHTKLVILEAGEGVPGEYHIMYVDGQRRSKTFSLSSLKRYGCDHAVRERLQHAMAVLAEFIERERKENNR